MSGAAVDGRRRRRLAGSAATLAALAGLGAVAAVDGLRGGGAPAPAPAASAAGTEPAPAVAGPNVPQPGALPGALVLTTPPACRLQVLDLGDLQLGEAGPTTACEVWPAPLGDTAVVSRPSRIEPDLRELWLVRLGEEPAAVERLGNAASAPSWSPDGRALAWCDRDGTSVLSLHAGDTERLPGCFPAFAPDGSVVTRARTFRGTFVLRDGEVALQRGRAPRGLPSPGTGRVQVVGHTVTGEGRLALAVVRTGAGRTVDVAVELWRGRTFERTLAVTSYGAAPGLLGLRVEAAPGAGELALTEPGTLGSPRPSDLVAVLDLRTGREAPAPTERTYAGHAWSPDGAWLALSTGTEILVYGSGRTDPVYVLPLAARSLAWVAG